MSTMVLELSIHISALVQCHSVLTFQVQIEIGTNQRVPKRISPFFCLR